MGTNTYITQIFVNLCFSGVCTIVDVLCASMFSFDMCMHTRLPMLVFDMQHIRAETLSMLTAIEMRLLHIPGLLQA